MGAFTVKVGGKEYDVDAPDEATAWKWAKATHLKSIASEGQVEKPPTPFRPSGETALSPGEELLANPYARAVVGAAKPVIGTGQLALNAVGQGEGINREMKNLADATAKAREYVGSTGLDLADMTGQVAALAGPAGLVKQAATTTGRIGQGAVAGGTAGLVEPVNDPNNYWGTKGSQVALGTVVGPVLPAAWEGSKAVGRAIRNVVQPHMGQAGADAAAGRLANQATGDKADEVINALMAAREVVPGSRPTAGQASVAANSAEFAALQKAAADRNPSAYYGPQGIEGQQNAARLAAVRSVGQDQAALAQAVSDRAKRGTANYGAAYAERIGADPTLLYMSRNPYFKDAMEDAVKLAKANKVDPQGDLTQFLHYVKVSLDKQLTKVGDTALGSTEKRTVEKLQKELVGWIKDANPKYDAARAQFARDSRPINQMEVGQELEKRLVPALGEEAGQRATVYAGALRDAPQTIKKATGQPRFESIEDVMTPRQAATLNAVQKDLARDQVATELAKAGRPAALERIGQAVPEAPPSGMFSPVISVARGTYNRATGKATDKILDELALKMQNPQEMARIMRDAKPFERKAIVDALMRLQGVGAANAVTQ